MKKKESNVTIEEMRYRVPGVCNRFWAVHKRFIALCALIVLIVVSSALSFVAIKSNRALEPKMTCVFFCELYDYEETVRACEKYSSKMDIFFVRYDERFKSEDSDIAYDLTELGGLMSGLDNEMINKMYIVVLSQDKSRSLNDYTYEQLGRAGKQTVADIEDVMTEVLG